MGRKIFFRTFENHRRMFFFFFFVFFGRQQKLRHQKNFFKKTIFLNLIPYSAISFDSTSRSVEKVEGRPDGLQNKCTLKIPRGNLPVNFFCFVFSSKCFFSRNFSEASRVKDIPL